jgi:hypothetical protein
MTDIPQWREPTEDEEQNARRVNGFSFREALALACLAVDPEAKGYGGDPRPLADYIAAVPLTMNEQQMHADFLRMLPASRPRGDRGLAKNGRSPETEAEYQVAQRVMEKMKTWCEQHPTRAGKPRKNVPDDVKRELIADDINNSSLSPQDRDTVVQNVLRLLANKSRL